MRKTKIERNTNETQIQMEINLDGTGEYKIDCPNGFLKHMLELFSKQSLIDLKLKASGDTFVDEHHLVEDIGIVLGKAVKEALGNKKGINRYGYFLLPMDETLALSAIDLSGRSFFVMEAEFQREKVGDLSTELIFDFFDSFTRNCECNLQLKILNGRNTHHKIEALFKSFARALRMAVTKDERNSKISSTKGLL
jgi:imidazoleglycerol-phosphate dehydratase